MGADSNPGRRRWDKGEPSRDPYSSIRERAGTVSRLPHPILYAVSDFAALAKIIPHTTFAKNNPKAAELLFKAPPQVDPAMTLSVDDYTFLLIHEQIAARSEGDDAYKSIRERIQKSVRGMMAYEKNKLIRLHYSTQDDPDLDTRTIENVGDKLQKIVFRTRDAVQDASIDELTKNYIDAEQYRGNAFTDVELFMIEMPRLLHGVIATDDPRFIAFNDIAEAAFIEVDFAQGLLAGEPSESVKRRFAQAHLRIRNNLDTIRGYHLPHERFRTIQVALLNWYTNFEPEDHEGQINLYSYLRVHRRILNAFNYARTHGLNIRGQIGRGYPGEN